MVIISEAGEIQPARFGNDAADHAQLEARLEGFPGCRVALEATGAYHLRLVQALAAAVVSVVNPAQANYFSKSQQRRNKTDQVYAAQEPWERKKANH